MSSHLRVYVGPFFSLPHIDAEEQTWVHRCTNRECGKPAKDRSAHFCNHCGHPAARQSVITSVNRPVQVRDLGGDWADLVCEVGLESSEQPAWLPNAHRFGTSFSSDSENQIYKLEPVLMEQQLARFKKVYAEIANAVKTQFGVELVAAYGAVPYYR